MGARFYGSSILSVLVIFSPFAVSPTPSQEGDGETLDLLESTLQ